MTATHSDPPLRVYWQPGCSSCLNVKEFLNRNGKSFQSINVLEDEEGLQSLLDLGARQVPVVARGTEWVDGQAIRDVARLVGINLDRRDVLKPAELVARLDFFLAQAGSFLERIPVAQLETRLPHRPRTYAGLACHIFQIAEAFLDLMEHGKRVEFQVYDQAVPEHLHHRSDLLAFGESVRERLGNWWKTVGNRVDFSATADVYFGDVDVHEFLERTTWHAGQHLRQLERVLVEKLDTRPPRPLVSKDFSGLPMPEQVWDDRLAF